MDIESLRKDVNASIDGVWFEFGSDARVKIAQFGNKKHAAFLRDVGKKHGRKLEQGAMSDKDAAAIMAKQWEFLITDAEGFNEKKKPVKYSVELFEKWALRKDLTDFFTSILEISRDELNYRMENIKALGEALLITESGATSGQALTKQG